MTTMVPTLCGSCVHYKDRKCPAFPRGIPNAIMIFGADHREVLPGQEGTTVHVLQIGLEQRYEDWLDTFVYPPD